MIMVMTIGRDLEVVEVPRRCLGTDGTTMVVVVRSGSTMMSLDATCKASHPRWAAEGLFTGHQEDTDRVNLNRRYGALWSQVCIHSVLARSNKWDGSEVEKPKI